MVETTKPRITGMVTVTTLAGAVIAPGRPSLARLVATLLATAAVVAAANIGNMVLERDVDARMARTHRRPIPSGRVSAESALAFGTFLALCGMLALAFLINLTTALLAAVALVSYVAVYTPLKRVTPLALHVGAVPGAIAPLIGWASMTGELGPAALSLFAILFTWQITHFLAISIFRRRDYECAGLAVYSTVHGIPAARRALFGYSILLLGVSFGPIALGLAGPIYATVALVLGVGQAVIAACGLRCREGWARRFFFASLPYPGVLLGCLALVAP